MTDLTGPYRDRCPGTEDTELVGRFARAPLAGFEFGPDTGADVDHNHPMLRILVLLLIASPALAAPVPLTSTIERAPLDPAVVVVPASSGKTTLERYRSGAKATSGTPLVVIVRLPDLNSPDTVTVTTAQRDGNAIKVAIETRRFDGRLGANVVTTPLVEIALGNLPKATYSIDIEERVLGFTKLGAPQTASKPRPGLSSGITLTVR